MSILDVTDPYSYTVLGMFAEELEDRIDLLYRESLQNPVPRSRVDNLLAEYGVEFSQLDTWMRGKVGDIEVCD